MGKLRLMRLMKNLTGMVKMMRRVKAMDLSGLKPHKIDMCPESCMAYTGEYEMMMNCCYVKEKVAACNEPRYSGRGRPRAQMIYISFLDVIKAMFANAE